MEQSIPDMAQLFMQLGLASSPEQIDAFIEDNRPLPPKVMLADAKFWSKSQADFLRSAVAHDAAWAMVVDQLNVALSVTPTNEIALS